MTQVEDASAGNEDLPPRGPSPSNPASIINKQKHNAGSITDQQEYKHEGERGR